MSDRPEKLLDIIDMPIRRFAMKYENVVINDGKVLDLQKRERDSHLFSYAGRRYYKVGC